MLKQIRIKGFRSFSQESFQTIRLSPFTIVVGENSSGKSNILKAMELCTRQDYQISREDFSVRKSIRTKGKRAGKPTEKKASCITIEIIIENQKKFFPKEYHKFLKGSEATLMCEVRGDARKGFEKSYNLNGKDVTKLGMNKRQDNKTVFSNLTSSLGFFNAPINRDAGNLKLFTDLLPKKRKSIIKKALVDANETIQKKALPYANLLRKATGLAVTVASNITPNQALAVAEPSFVVQKPFKLPLTTEGQGIINRALVALFLAMGRNCIVGIEEPELHMHPTAVKTVVDYFRKGNKTQIIATTHSVVVGNMVDLKNVARVKKVGNYSKIYQLPSPFDLSGANTGLQYLLNVKQKSEILFSKGVLLVDGVYDRLIYELILRHVTGTVSPGEISIIDVGGHGEYFKFADICLPLGTPWVIVGDKNSFYNNSTGGAGPVLVELIRRTWLDQASVDSLVATINSPKNRSRELKKANEMLTEYLGGILILDRNDVSHAVLAAASNFSDYDGLYKYLGGTEDLAPEHAKRKFIETGIRSKGHQMVRVVEYMKGASMKELQRLLRKALQQVQNISRSLSPKEPLRVIPPQEVEIPTITKEIVQEEPKELQVKEKVEGVI